MSAPLRVEVLVLEACPSAREAYELATSVAGRLAPGAEVRRVLVESDDEARRLEFQGSPSILVNGKDIAGRYGASSGLACRLYDGGSGLPPEWLVEAAVLRALGLRGLLFLCVANSARSQMAEGIARSLAAPGLVVASAGSHPTRVRPEAIAVLQEIGIDISGQRSKRVAEIPVADVDTVITLCAEEVCPVYLGNARRLNWGLADPAAVEGSDDRRLAAFGKTRDELRRRIAALLGEPLREGEERTC
jgi:arsenate reductase